MRRATIWRNHSRPLVERPQFTETGPWTFVVPLSRTALAVDVVSE
jgi:hypothetical protein